MKKLASLLFILSFFSITAFAQSADVKAVENQIELLRKSMTTPINKAGLNSVTAADLSYGHSNDVIQTKADFINWLETGKSAFTKIDIKDQTIHVNGNTAVVRHKFYADSNDGGKPGVVSIANLMVWKKINGKWLLIARQAYKISPLPVTPAN